MMPPCVFAALRTPLLNAAMQACSCEVGWADAAGARPAQAPTTMIETARSRVPRCVTLFMPPAGLPSILVWEMSMQNVASHLVGNLPWRLAPLEASLPDEPPSRPRHQGTKRSWLSWCLGVLVVTVYGQPNDR